MLWGNHTSKGPSTVNTLRPLMRTNGYGWKVWKMLFATLKLSVYIHKLRSYRRSDEGALITGPHLEKALQSTAACERFWWTALGGPKLPITLKKCVLQKSFLFQSKFSTILHPYVSNRLSLQNKSDLLIYLVREGPNSKPESFSEFSEYVCGQLFQLLIINTCSLT